MQTSSSSTPKINLSLVSDLNPGQSLWNMKVRVIRKWIQRNGMEFIFIDEKGQKIQAGVKNFLVPLFKDEVFEDDILILSKFGVGLNTDRYKVIMHDYKVIFYKSTTVQRDYTWGAVEYGFVFIPHELITKREANELLSVDVCGTVVDSGTLDIYGEPPKQSKRMMLDLQDDDGHVVTCTLWNEYAQNFSNIVSKLAENQHIMVVIQHGRIKPWKGELQVHTDMFATRVWINPELNETNDLKRSLLKKFIDDGGSSSQIVLSTQTVYPVRQEFVHDTPKKNVDEITELEEPMSCVVVGTIKIVQQKYGWYYAACRVCAKKVLTKSQYLEKCDNIAEDILNLPTDAMICFKCNRECTSIIPRFKVQVRVQDGTGSLSFVLFDSHVARIVGASADDVRERQVTDKDLETFPHELSRLVDKKLAFKIEVSEFNLKNQYHVYTVQKICDDPVILAELVASTEGIREMSQVDSQIQEVMLAESSQHIATPESKALVSVTGESSVEPLPKESSASPNGKRGQVDSSNVDSISDLSSTTKRSRKKPTKFES